MRVVIDIEANGLKPTHIWCIVCKDIDTNERHIFRNPTEAGGEDGRDRFLKFAEQVDLWIGHNVLGYDLLVLTSLLNLRVEDIVDKSCDTLILSRLLDYSRVAGHSIEDYGIEFGIEKSSFKDYIKYSIELENRCITDVDIAHKIFNKYSKFFYNADWASSIQLEHLFQWKIVNALEKNGFAFASDRSKRLLERVTKETAKLDEEILAAFPPKEVLIREFTPRETKHGTISKTSVPKALWDKIPDYEVGKTYRHTHLVDFNPSSHKQIIEVLREAGWSPVDKTKTHIETERELHRLRYSRGNESGVDLAEKSGILKGKLEELRRTGWKINENNLTTLPPSAPPPARLLAKRILLESRRRTLTEWLGLVEDDGRIHGRFFGIGTWPHRMAHQHPNVANIPTEAKLFGKEMRALWQAPKNRLLVGVDAEGIQLRILAHYIEDAEFTEALVKGRKDDKSDPHSLNARILGDVCKGNRQTAKRFIYALILGAGIGKLAEILGSSEDAARDALDRIMARYTGWADLKERVVPIDAKRGWFTGIDGRLVRLPSETAGGRRHLAMSGYLQNGEAIIIKRAAVLIDEKLSKDKELRDWMFVNIVHDELQSEIKNDLEYGMAVAQIKADCIKEAGELYKLKCPLAGSYWNDDHKEFTINVNWSKTH